MTGRNVNLNETGEWLLYRAMVCEAIDLNQKFKAKLDVDPWEFSSALDMSFEETREFPLEYWHIKIKQDLQEMDKDPKFNSK